MVAIPRPKFLLAFTSLCLGLVLPTAAQRTPVVTSERALATHTTAGHVPRGTMVVGAPGAVVPDGFSRASWSIPTGPAEYWTPIAPTSFGARFAHRVVAIGDRLHVTGGADENYLSTDHHERYDPATGTWTARAPMPGPTHNHSAAVVNGRMYVFGGNDTVGAYAQSAVYDPALDAWSLISQPPTARRNTTASVVGGKVYVIGGASAAANDVATVEEYDPLTDTWSTRTPMPTSRAGGVAAVIAGRIHVLGGEIYSQQAPNTIHEIYDPATDSWTTGPPLLVPVNLASAAVVGDLIHVTHAPSPFTVPNEVQVYHAATQTWTVAQPTRGTHFWADAAAVGGRIYLVEGVTWNTPNPKPQQGVEVLDVPLPLFVRD